MSGCFFLKHCVVTIQSEIDLHQHHTSHLNIRRCMSYSAGLSNVGVFDINGGQSSGPYFLSLSLLAV